ncbi:SPBC776.05, partial [Symbiodinium necroappetens]
RRYRISRHACRRDATVSRLFRCNRVFASLVNTVTTLVTYVYRWFLPRAEIKRIAHAITGNISMRELQEALNKLGMNQQWHEQAAKALLQDSARKQTAQELFEAGLLFDLGKLIHDTPVSSASPPQSGGKGTGKGKGKSRPSARTPWADLTPRPAAIFEDGAKNPLSVISIKVAHAAAKGVFLAGVGEFESFLDITSNSPLAMLVPQTPKVRSILQSRGVAFAERLVALHDPNSDITTPKPVFLITLGGSVVFAEATPDAQFEAPVPTVEVAIDIEIHCIDPCMQQEVEKYARYAFKQIVHAAFSEQIVSECYSVFVRASVLQGIIKIPVSQLMNVLRVQEALLQKSNLGFVREPLMREVQHGIRSCGVLHPLNLTEVVLLQKVIYKWSGIYNCHADNEPSWDLFCAKYQSFFKRVAVELPTIEPRELRRSWASLRAKHLRKWQTCWASAEIYGGIANKREDLRSQSFFLICRNTLIGAAVSQPVTVSNGTPQGCPLSILSVNALMSIWADSLRQRVPELRAGALTITDQFDNDSGSSPNRDKTKATALTVTLLVSAPSMQSTLRAAFNLRRFILMLGDLVDPHIRSGPYTCWPAHSSATWKGRAGLASQVQRAAEALALHWASPFELEWTGGSLSLLNGDASHFLSKLCDFARHAVLKRAAKRPCLRGVASQVDTLASSALLRSPSCSSYDKGVLRSILCNGVLTQHALHAQGSASSSMCPFCKRQPETLLHLCWSCPHWEDIRSSFRLPILSEAQQWPVCTQLCGIFHLPDCIVHAQTSLEAETFCLPHVPLPVSGCSVLPVWVDGSVFQRDDPRLARAGAGVFVWGGCRHNLKFPIQGPVQSVERAGLLRCRDILRAKTSLSAKFLLKTFNGMRGAHQLAVAMVAIFNARNAASQLTSAAVTRAAKVSEVKTNALIAELRAHNVLMLLRRAKESNYTTSPVGGPRSGLTYTYGVMEPVSSRCLLRSLLASCREAAQMVSLPNEKWRTGAPTLPLALIHQSHLREKDLDKAVKAATGLAGFCGIHRSSTGSKSLRLNADGIANARTTL